MPRSCAMYRAVLVSAGTAPTTRFVFSSALAPDVPDGLEPPPQAAARANGRTPRTATAAIRLPLAILISLLNRTHGRKPRSSAERGHRIATLQAGQVPRPVTGRKRPAAYYEIRAQDPVLGKTIPR